MVSRENSIKKLYYSIGEVSKITELKQYVLRYWETEFTQLNPNKNKAGNRTYRQKDIDLILRVKELLYKRKFTIEGARHELSRKVTSSQHISSMVEPGNNLAGKESSAHNKELLITIRSELKALIDNINQE